MTAEVERVGIKNSTETVSDRKNFNLDRVSVSVDATEPVFTKVKVNGVHVEMKSRGLSLEGDSSDALEIVLTRNDSLSVKDGYGGILRISHDLVGGLISQVQKEIEESQPNLAPRIPLNEALEEFGG